MRTVDPPGTVLSPPGCSGHTAPFASIWHHLVGIQLLLLATMVFCGPVAQLERSLVSQMCLCSYPQAGAWWGGLQLQPLSWGFILLWVWITNSKSPTPGQAVGRGRPRKPPSPVFPLKRKQGLHLGVSEPSSVEFPATHKAIIL